MPEFIPRATNTSDLSEIAQGILECAEFADLPEEYANKPVRGWLRSAKVDAAGLAKRFCVAAGQGAIAAALAAVCDGVAYDERRLGHDIWYSTVGHGTGFFDRDAEAIQALDAVAQRMRGEGLVERNNQGWLYLECYP